MQNTSYTAKTERLLIIKLIEHVLHLFMLGKATEEKIKNLKEKLDNLNRSNPDFYALLHDRRENNKMFIFVIVAAFSIPIDFILIVNPISILCNGLQLPDFLKYLIPVVLIIIEVGFGYTSIMRKNSGEADNFVGRNLQLCIIAILIALSAGLILYLVKGYNERFDGPFLHFLVSNTILQIILLIPSILIHLWIIRHAEFIMEAVAYTKYLYDHNNKVNQIEKLEEINRKKHYPRFIKSVQTLVQKKQHYEAIYGDGEFDKIVPLDLAIAVNKIMGRTVFYYEAEIKNTKLV